MTLASVNHRIQLGSLVSHIRAFDRFTAGRRVACLAAIGVLAGREPELALSWRHFRNGAVHYADTSALSDELNRLGSALEDARPELGRIFTTTLIADILQSGGVLPALAATASAVVEAFGDRDPNDFGNWFDAALDEISHGRQVGEVTTPRTLARLMARIADPQSGTTVLDPACGLGATLIEMSGLTLGLKLSGQEVGALAAALATLRLYLLGLDADVRLGDALRAPAYWADASSRFDRVICDPPYGMAINLEADSELRQRFGHLPTSRSEPLFVQHCLDSLKPGGRAVLLLPLGFLARRGGEARYRGSLVEAGRIEGIIGLPGGVIPWTDLPSAIVVLRGDQRPGAPITLVDASYLRQVGKRAVERLTPEQVDELVGLYHSGQDTERSTRVDPQMVMESEVDLQPQRWIRPNVEPEADPGELFQRATEAEARAEVAKAELDQLMVYFKLRS